MGVGGRLPWYNHADNFFGNSNFREDGKWIQPAIRQLAVSGAHPSTPPLLSSSPLCGPHPALGGGAVGGEVCGGAAELHPVGHVGHRAILGGGMGRARADGR